MNTISRFIRSPMFLSWTSLGIRLLGNSFLIILISVRFTVDETAVWLMLITINNVFIAADLGISPLFARMFSYALGGATIYDMAGRIGSRDTPAEPAGKDANWPLIRDLFSQQRLFLTGLSIFILIVGGAIGTWSLYPRIEAMQNPIEGVAAWIVVLISSAFILSGKCYADYLMGTDRVALQKKWETVFSAIAMVLALGSMLVIHNLLALSVVYFVTPMVVVFVHRHFAFTLNEGKLRSNSHFWHVDREVWSILWPQGWRIALGIFFSQVVLNYSSLVLARGVDAARAAQLLFSLRFVRILDNFSTTPFYVYIPRMSRLRFEGRQREFWKIAERGMLVSLMVLTIPGILIAIAAPPFLHAVHSKVDLVSPPVWLLLVLGTVIQRYGALHIQLVTLTNKIVWHTATISWGAVFIALLVGGLHWMTPDVAYAVALLVSTAAIYTPYCLSHSYPHLDRAEKIRDAGIAALGIGTVAAALAVSIFV
jgi:O-antigen/teichoic acid export membrane protein